MPGTPAWRSCALVHDVKPAVEIVRDLVEGVEAARRQGTRTEAVAAGGHRGGGG